MEETKDIYKRSRLFFILWAALEYFISLLVTEAYLAKLTIAIGMSDALTGILSSFVSLGCGFQILAIFFVGKKSVKKFVTILDVINQSFFGLLFFIPFIDISYNLKIILFVVLLLSAHVIKNIIYAPKINWFMSLVDDNERGNFTANKEIVSLIGGMIFSLVMGKVIDAFEDNGNLKGAFITFGISIFVLMVGHGCLLIFSKEKTNENVKKEKVLPAVKELFKQKDLLKVVLLSVLWNIANYVAKPFYGTYQNKELGFSMTFISILVAANTIVRAIFSKPLGKYADKTSFAKMLNICFACMLAAFAINIFTIPANGKVLFTIYYVLYGIGMAGINSAVINLIYDYVDKDKRTEALALRGMCAGFAGFLTTVIVSPLVKYIQANGNKLFGISVYAQQVVSLIAVLIIIVVILYLNLVIRKLNKKVKEVN